MNKREINALLLIGVIGLFTVGTQFGINLGRAVWGDREIWWTPRSMALSLEETSDRFRLFIDGKPLQEHLADNSLAVADEAGASRVVAPEDVRVRLNNWHQMRANFFMSALPGAFGLGVSITCLVLGLIHRRQRKNEI